MLYTGSTDSRRTPHLKGSIEVPGALNDVFDDERSIRCRLAREQKLT